MRSFKLAAALALGVTAAALSGCATGFPAQVSRYQAMPAPQGQSFIVVPMDARQAGGLEFSRYASMVAQGMQAQGYAPANSINSATMVVRLGYGVDEGSVRYDRDPFGYGGYPGYGYGGYGGYGGGYGYRGGYRGVYTRPYYSRWGHYGARSPFYYGWDSPFGSPYGYGGGISSYTVYRSHLNMDIRRKGDNASLFEGRAQARSHNDNLAVLVPNLVEAMFTGFPGRSGETVRITVAPPPRGQRY
ncbi:MAG: DUF4136 domain-containing protein [Pseudomonadota bacterium]|nr:DUF4136 domain-containing protein [Pseudomonadota bacterium]